MADAREAARLGWTVRQDLEVVEKIAATRNDPELGAALERLHATLQGVWAKTREHFDIPAPRSGGTDKPQQP